MQRKSFFIFSVFALFISSCSTIKSNTKSAIAFPGMTVSREDYKLSKDVSAEVTVKEWTTLFGIVHGTKAIGETKRVMREGIVSGYALDQASKIAAYRLLENNPSFDYLTNIRIQKEFTRKWLFLFTKYKTNVKITAKGITLNTEK